MAAPDMQKRSFRYVDEERGRILFVEGELGIEVAGALRESIQQALADGRGPVVLDLSDVGFMDSTGLSVIIASLREAWSRGQGLVVAGPLAPTVANLFSLTGVDRFVTIHPDRDTALSVLRP